MKHFNRFLCLVLALTMVLMAFAACEKKETEKKSKAPVDTTQPTETDPPVTNPPETDPPVTNPSETDPPVTNPSETDPPVTNPPETDPSETNPPETDPPETDPPETKPPVDPYGDEPAAVMDLSKKLEMKVVKSLEWKEDNSLLVRYKPCVTSHFEIACAFYEDAGYTLYCEDNTANTMSKTYVKGKAYATVFYLDRKSELHVTVSEEGAQNFPDQNAPYEKLYPVTMTQPFVSKQGLCEIFRLTDGSFLLFDGSNSGAQDYIWSTLCELNGSSSNIHIRAWVLTHTHGDHYGGFRDFAYAYGSRVKLDTVFYNPVNRDIIKTIEDYMPVLGNTWDTIDYSFNKGVTGSPSLAEIWTERFEGAKLCSVHAGQKFHLAGADLHILYTAEHLYIDEIPVNMNNTSIVSHVTSDEGKALVTGDSGSNSTMWTIKTYYKALESDIFQIPHHGMSTADDVTLAKLVKGKIILIPCTVSYYEKKHRVHTITIRELATTVASFIMGEGTVTCRLDGTIAPNAPMTPEPSLDMLDGYGLGEIIGKELVKTFVGDDFLGKGGYKMYRYEGCALADYDTLFDDYKDRGWELYCEDVSNNTSSFTYVKNDAYATVLFLKKTSQLHVTVSETGASNLPVQDTVNAGLYPVTITQPKTAAQGMCQIFHLTDGSFLIFDGSNNGSQDAIWSNLVELNGGSSKNIHIRAWVLTHSHGDHYNGFRNFSMSYSRMVKLDYVLFAPVNREIWDTVEGYKPTLGNTWDTIDYSFNREKNGGKSQVQTWVEKFAGAKLCVVHAGQVFDLGGTDLRVLYTPEHLYVDQIPTDMNHSSMICQVVSSDGKALITGDAGAGAKKWLMNVYQEDLRSNIYQHPHHGMTQAGDVTLATWTQAKIVLIPCTVEYYAKNANARTEEIRKMSHVVASHVMGEGTVTYRLDGTRVN